METGIRVVSEQAVLGEAGCSRRKIVFQNNRISTALAAMVQSGATRGKVNVWCIDGERFPFDRLGYLYAGR